MKESGNVAATPKTSHLHFDILPIISISGFLKVFQLILNFSGLISIETSGVYSDMSRSTYYEFVSGTAICVTSILFILYAFHVTEKLSLIPWLKFEFIYCVLWTIFYFVAGMLTIGIVNGNLNLAGWIAFIALVFYALDGCYKFWMIKTGQPAQ